MEIKGDDFLKRIQVQQERDELEQKLNELEEVESSINPNPTPQMPKQNVPEQDDQELGNIMLENSTSNEENKKKYLVLGLVLVVLFLLTIIIIRLLTDGSKEDPFTADKTESLEVAKSQEESNIEENFQKIMNDRIKKNNEEKNEEIISEEKLNAIKPKVEPKKESISNNDLDETIKKIEQKKKEVVKKPEPVQVVKKEAPKKVEPKVEPKKSIKNLVQSTSSAAPNGYFVQIGAFTKKPSNKYINNIRNAGLKYKVYQVEVKGKLYNKVLIGPYSSRASAKQNIDTIKKKLNISSAYVLKF